MAELSSIHTKEAARSHIKENIKPFVKHPPTIQQILPILNTKNVKLMYQGAKGINFTYQKHDESLDFYKENIKSVIKTFQMQQHFQKQ